MKVFIHIGHHKTGSTFLQKKVFKNHPNIKLINRYEAQKVFLKKGSFFFERKIARKWFSEQVSSLQKEQNRIIVISDEELSGNIHTGGNGGYLAKEVADRLFSVIPDAHILIFIRNQFEIIESAYRQYIKKGGTFSVNRYLFDTTGHYHRFPQFSFDHFEYNHVIKYYTSLFGADNVHIFIYEKMRENISLFFNDFFSELGIPPLDYMEKIVQKRVNEKFSFASVALARITNRFYGADPINRRVILNIPFFYKTCKRFYKRLDNISLIKSFDREKRMLSKKAVDHIALRYRDSNRELSDMLGVDLGVYGYPV